MQYINQVQSNASFLTVASVREMCWPQILKQRSINQLKLRGFKIYTFIRICLYHMWSLNKGQ